MQILDRRGGKLQARSSFCWGMLASVFSVVAYRLCAEHWIGMWSQPLQSAEPLHLCCICSLRSHRLTVPDIEAHSPCQKRCWRCPHWPWSTTLTLLSSSPSYPFPPLNNANPALAERGTAAWVLHVPKPPIRRSNQPRAVSLLAHIKLLHPHPPQLFSLQLVALLTGPISPRRQCPK